MCERCTSSSLPWRSDVHQRPGRSCFDLHVDRIHPTYVVSVSPRVHFHASFVHEWCDSWFQTLPCVRRRHAHVYGSDRHVFVRFGCVRVFVSFSFSFLLVPPRPLRSTSTSRSAIVASTHLPDELWRRRAWFDLLSIEVTPPFRKEGIRVCPFLSNRESKPIERGGREKETTERIETHRIVPPTQPPCLSLSLTHTHVVCPTPIPRNTTALAPSHSIELRRSHRRSTPNGTRWGPHAQHGKTRMAQVVTPARNNQAHHQGEGAKRRKNPNQGVHPR